MVNATSSWHNKAMEIPVDKAGRMVVPKPVRDRLGLQREGKLELVEGPEGYVLKPVEAATGLIRDEDGWLVIPGDPNTKIDWFRIVDDDREDRMRKIGGW
jgi:AbrB family looped-hinge helix DNA binding protein